MGIDSANQQKEKKILNNAIVINNNIQNVFRKGAALKNRSKISGRNITEKKTTSL